MQDEGVLNSTEDNDFKAKVGKLIRRLRREANKTQGHLADESGLHTNYIGLVERGKRLITVGALRRIVKALGTTLAEFFARMGE